MQPCATFDAPAVMDPGPPSPPARGRAAQARAAKPAPRTSNPLPGVLRFGHCELRLHTRELLLQGQLQPVRKRVFELILYLVARRPRTVSHAELLQAVWQRTSASPSVIARAVMEARRACGDGAAEPVLFLSVHGVGYRFVGAVAEGAVGAAAGAEATPGGVEDVDRLVAQAREAMRVGRLEDAQVLAEQALSQADACQSHAGRVRALALCSAVALRKGTAAAAASLAAEALRVARGEGDALLIAQARLAVGLVHLVAGDRALALSQFEQARGVLELPGHEQDLLLCLNRMAMAFRDVGNADSALEISRRALAVARRVGTAHQIAIERNNEVMFMLLSVEQGDREGRQPESRLRYTETLQLVDALLAELEPSAPQRQSALGNRAVLLEKLGRLDEAWTTLAQFEQTLDLKRLASSPVYAERQGIFKMQRAGLLMASGRIAEAVVDARAGVEAAESSGQDAMLPRLYAQGSEIAERAGQLPLALTWARRQAAVQAALQASRAATLASILHAEMNTEALQESLQRAQSQVAQLQQDNAALREQADRLKAAVPVSATTSLAQAEHLALLLGAAHQRARDRGLPMCLGVFEQVVEEGKGGSPGRATMDAVIKRLATVLRDQTEIAQPAFLLDAARVVFHVRDAGLRRAQQVCDRLALRLSKEAPLALADEAQPVFRCTAEDAAAHDTLDDWLCAVRARGLPTSP